MSDTTAPHTLLPKQSRLINASEGSLLEVQSGCMWLTRPDDSVDRFLVAGTSIELHENFVLVQSDSPGAAADTQSTRYWLTPLSQPRALAQAIQARKPRRLSVLKPIFGS